MADSCRLRLFLALFMAALSAFPSPCSSRELQQDNLTVLIPFDPSKVIQLSWQPRVFFYEKFLSDEDCDHLIALAQGKLERLVVDASKENSVMYSINVSSGMFVPRGQDEVVSKVEEKIS
ncbi:hypothetical protein ZIOFF_049457 [Zingiber officinale]|uniref:Uncharacterized protein n=1 Tax=Zingiber officinale TaxID=94328 RepID=A0A8J5KTA3_ZINOF|nr:hypothetical protein ZIOFF_049457 [Zingiber officinale]